MTSRLSFVGASFRCSMVRHHAKQDYSPLLTFTCRSGPTALPLILPPLLHFISIPLYITHLASFMAIHVRSSSSVVLSSHYSL